MFNADQYLAALEKPSVTINGKTFTGRILSIEEFAPFADTYNKAFVEKTTTLTDAQFRDYATKYLRAVFPWKVFYKWRPDPVKEVLNHPAFVRIFTDFFSCQAMAVGMMPLPSKTSGTDSPEQP